MGPGLGALAAARAAVPGRGAPLVGQPRGRGARRRYGPGRARVRGGESRGGGGLCLFPGAGEALFGVERSRVCVCVSACGSGGFVGVLAGAPNFRLQALLYLKTYTISSLRRWLASWHVLI